jgi:hypothetical protein
VARLEKDVERVADECAALRASLAVERAEVARLKATIEALKRGR